MRPADGGGFAFDNRRLAGQRPDNLVHHGSKVRADLLGYNGWIHVIQTVHEHGPYGKLKMPNAGDLPQRGRECSGGDDLAPRQCEFPDPRGRAFVDVRERRQKQHGELLARQPKRLARNRSLFHVMPVKHMGFEPSLFEFEEQRGVQVLRLVHGVGPDQIAMRFVGEEDLRIGEGGFR